MKKEKKNTIIKAIWIAAAVVTAAGLIWLGRTEYKAKYERTVIDSSVSADGKYELLFESVGEADWPFGASHAGLVLKQNGRTVTKYRFDVANDGKTLCADNWQVTWNESSASVRISGEEQQDVLYLLTFDGEAEVRR